MLANDRQLYYLALPVTVGLLLFARNLFRTKVGKAFVAIRDQDISAEVMGVNVFRYKLLSFAVSSFFVGVAGSLLAYQARIISPENFPISAGHRLPRHDHHRRPGQPSSARSSAPSSSPCCRSCCASSPAPSSTTFPELITLFASVKMGVFGLVVVLFLIFEPDGMAARWHHIKNYWKLYPFSY